MARRKSQAVVARSPSRAALAAQRRLARDYAAGRDDASTLLAELEAAQLELLVEP